MNADRPTPHAAPSDRRQRRSADPLVALHYQLSSIRHEAQLETLVVADPSGLVVAGAGAWPACEELAAYAPLLADGRWCDASESSSARVAQIRSEVSVVALDVAGHNVLLCARGRAERDLMLARAAEGVERILRAAA